MKQVAQRLKDGRIEVRDVPPPDLNPNGVLVQVHASLLSAGTERAKVDTARKSLLNKARARPDQARQVIEKARRDGLRDTVGAVRTRLDQPSPLGYSAAGEAIAVGAAVRGISPGDRVACGGESAGHAEIICVPGNLCVRMPNGVEWAHGAFTAVGSIALHGVRQADARLGERVAVIGLGLVGQLCARLLRAGGCTVVGVDLLPDSVERAQGTGAVDHGFRRDELAGERLPAAAADCDAVIIAAATAADDPVELAAELCRDRGRVVVVGAVGMTLPRAPYYEREIDLRLSRSYGPGRYDREYEARGLDYPIGYVRWTGRRNMGAFLDLVGAGAIDIEPLITRRLPVGEAPAAYERLLERSGSPLGIVLEYETGGEESGQAATPPERENTSTARTASPTSLGLIGAGSFAQRILIPSFKSAGFELAAVASHSGLTASAAVDRFGFRRAVSTAALLEDPEVSLAAIATRHSSHASLACQALEAGLAVFVEKPPCLTEEELERLRAARDFARRPLFVGFNRRHAPLALRLRERLAGRDAPLELLVRVNAGPLEPTHWLNDPDEGGGRLLGEGCHFIDFACWLTDSTPTGVACTPSVSGDAPVATAQQFAVTLSFADGSIATILYGVGGANRLGKEYVEAHWQGHSAVLDDFRSLSFHGGRRRRRPRASGQDKGHRDQARAVRDALQDGRPPAHDLDPLDSMAVTLAALRSALTGQSIAPGKASSTGSD